MNAVPPLADYQCRFAGHIRDPDHRPAPTDIPERRMGIYRELFFNNVDTVLANSFPLLRSVFNSESWRLLVYRFFAGHRARTPLLYELPGEFVTWLEHNSADHGPEYLCELARFEWLELALSLSEDALAEPQFAGSEPLSVRLSPLVRIVACRHAVHRMAAGQAPEGPFPTPLFLALFRDRKERVRHLELSPLSAELLRQVAERPGRPVATLLSELAQEIGAADPERFAAQGSELIGQLIDVGVLIRGEG